jgi:hypothetical protein
VQRMPMVAATRRRCLRLADLRLYEAKRASAA